MTRSINTRSGGRDPRARNHRQLSGRAPGRASTSGPITTSSPALRNSLLAAIVLGVVAAMWWLAPPPPTETAGCFFAIDAQGSTEEMRDNYLNWLSSHINECAAEDRARVDIALVSGKTRTTAVAPVTRDFADLEYTGNEIRDKEILKTKVEQMVKEANASILSAPKQGGGTNIIGAICLAQEQLKGRSPATLFIYSDGHHNVDPYNLREIDLSEAQIDGYVEDLTASGQLCNLADVEVRMYGTGIGTGTRKMAAEQLAGMERFWRAVFDATGAELVAYQGNP